jgi:hypothetical protein
MLSARSIVGLTLVGLALLLTGCGTKYQSATGEIVYPDGSPVTGLTGGTIVFQQAGNPAGKTASSAIDSNGRFRLSTDTLGDGAEPGDYQVIITPPAPPGDEQLPPVIDPKYSQAGGHTETFTVKKGSNHFKVIVEKAP